MRILHIYDELIRGSIYSIVVDLSKHLAKKGHNVTILIRGEESDCEDIENVKIIWLKSRKIADIPYMEENRLFGPLRMFLDFFFVWTKVNRFLKKNDFDIIHVHTPFSSNILVTLNRELRKKIVYTAHVGEEAKRFNVRV